MALHWDAVGIPGDGGPGDGMHLDRVLRRWGSSQKSDIEMGCQGDEDAREGSAREISARRRSTRERSARQTGHRRERDAVPGKRVVLGHIGPLTWGSGRSRRGLRGSAAPPQEARCLQAPWRSKRPPRAQRFSGTQAPGAAARRTPSSASSAAASSASSANIAQRSAAQRGARSGAAAAAASQRGRSLRRSPNSASKLLTGSSGLPAF